MKIKITADSTCDLPRELVEQYNIHIFPLYVVMDGKAQRDGIDIVPQDIFDHVAAGGKLGNTAAVNVADYLERFRALRAEYDAVIHFTISESMSACFQNATIAAAELEGIYVIDSQNLSTGIGHLVLDACALAAEGMDAADIKAELDSRKEKLDVSFVLSTLEYLRRGGRCSSVTALGANLLKLHPCIIVKDGAMTVGKKYRGKIQECLVAYVKDKLAEPDTVDTRRIFITDSGFDAETVALVEKTIRECAAFEEIIHTRAGCTVSCHCGPGCLGILFYRK